MAKVKPPGLRTTLRCCVQQAPVVACFAAERPGPVCAAFAMIVVEVIEGVVCLSSLYFFGSNWIKIFTSGALLKFTSVSLVLLRTECLLRYHNKVPQTAGVMPVMEFIQSLKLWHCAHKMAADMAVSFLMVSIFVVHTACLFFFFLVGDLSL